MNGEIAYFYDQGSDSIGGDYVIHHNRLNVCVF